MENSLDLDYLLHITFRKLRRENESLNMEDWKKADYVFAVDIIAKTVKETLVKYEHPKTIGKERIGSELHSIFINFRHTEHYEDFCFEYQTLQRMHKRLRNLYGGGFSEYAQNVLAVYMGFPGWRGFLNDCEKFSSKKPSSFLKIMEKTDKYRDRDDKIIKAISPEVLPFLKGEKEIPEDDEILKNKVESHCLRITTFWDDYMSNKDFMDKNLYEKWVDFARELYQDSKPIREYIKTYKSVFSDELFKVLKLSRENL